MSKADTRILLLEAIAASRYTHSFPEEMRSEFKDILRRGDVKEVSALLHIFSSGHGYLGEYKAEPLLDDDDWKTLLRDKNEKNRLAAAEVMVQWLENPEIHLTPELANTLLLFSNESCDNV